MANCYWFNPKTKNFYGPAWAHFAVDLPEELDEKFLDSMKLTDDLYDPRFRENWVRLTYNVENQELSCNALNRTPVFKCVKEFISRKMGVVNSLFLDINNKCTRTRIEGISLVTYLETGKIKLDQFQ